MAEPMLSESNGTAPEPEISAVPEQRRREWRLPAMITVALVAAIFLVFWQTSASVVAIWIRSETFTHGFLILPISAWLIWQKGDELLRATPAPNWLGIPLLLLIGVGWLIAHTAGVLVVEQLAMMAMVPAAVWTLLGWQVTRLIVFPLGFLFFAVPMGEELIPPMMDFTANFTVSALQLTGIPVFREGTFFEIPSGRWSVVEGCSGVRYLIASVTLGCLYAYLTFRSQYRRLLFVALAVVVPVIANGMRAYMIVMIAHLSDMRLAMGVDHFIYGWIFFGVVMLLLFWLGSFWREDHPGTAPGLNAPLSATAFPQPKPLLMAAIVVLLAVGVWPAAGALEGQDPVPVGLSLSVPAGRQGWAAAAAPLTDWQPHYINTDAALNQTYRLGAQRVDLYIAYYRRQRQGAELINSQNYLIKQKDKVWRQTADSPHEVTVDGRRLEVRLAKMRSNEHQDLLVWYWYWVDGRTTTNHYLAKLWDTKARLLGGKGDAAAIIVSTPFSEDQGESEQTLQAFMNAMAPAIESSLVQVGRE